MIAQIFIGFHRFHLSAYINIRQIWGGFCLWSGCLQWVDGGLIGWKIIRFTVMKYLVVLAFCVGFINLKSNKANANLLINPIDTSKYAILSYNETYWPLDFDKDSKSYSLSLNDIKQIEFLLNKEVIKINKEAKRKIIKNPSKRYKQLIAVYNSKGEKIVWVNCMCDINDEPNWKKKVIDVLDGGPCYFNFKINLTTNKIYDFEINGVA